MGDEEIRLDYYIDRIRTNNILASDNFIKIDGDIEVMVI